MRKIGEGVIAVVYGWYIAGGLLLMTVLTLLLLLRVGVEFCLDAPLRVSLRVGPFRRTLSFPSKPKQTPPRSEKKSGGEKTPPQKRAGLSVESGKRCAKLLAPALKRALGRTRRSVRLHPLNLHVVIATDDPAQTAQLYGWAEAAMWSLMPQAERLLTIPDPHVRVDADFDAQQTRVEGEIGCTIRVGSILLITWTMLPPLLRCLRILAGERKTTQEKPDDAQAPSDTLPETPGEGGEEMTRGD